MVSPLRMVRQAMVGGGVSEASEHGGSFSKDRPQDRLRAASPQSAIRRSLGRRKSACASTSVGCSTVAAPPTLDRVSAHRLLSALLVAPDEDPPLRRSQRDWIIDGALFLLAVAVGAMALADASRPRAGRAPAGIGRDRWRGALPRSVVAAAMAARSRAGLRPDAGLLVLSGCRQPDHLVHGRRLSPLAAGGSDRRTAARHAARVPQRAPRRQLAAAVGVLRPRRRWP